ncbi:MAG: DUF4199 family protein [Deinococcales bacterium]|nr:DUF4199 family protein [Chitinophagaceae bacterium]
MSLQKSSLSSRYIVYALIASIAYLLPTAYFLLGNGNTKIWLPYLGNFLFFISIVVAIAFFNVEAHQHANVKSLLYTGLRTTIIAAIFCALVAFVLAAIKYDYFTEKTNEAIQAAQTTVANSAFNSNNEAGIMIIINALIVNFIMGILGSLIGASVNKRNQTTVKGTELV